MKIAIIQTVTPEISEYTKYTVGINSQYCVERGYEYHIVQNELGKERHPSWNRLKAVERFLHNRYDWIMVVDADAIVQNDTITIESIIEQAENAHILICDDTANGGFVNCGVMLFKGGSHVSQTLIDTWWNLANEDAPYKDYRWTFPYEQHVFREILQNDKSINANPLAIGLVKIFPIDTFNSHWLHIPKDNFIAHIMARPNNERAEILKQIYNRIF